MSIVERFKAAAAKFRSKHQVHVRKAKRRRGGVYARATCNPAGTKLAKYFMKASQRGPRGY